MRIGIEVWIPGAPVPKGRARSRIYRKPNGAVRIGTYTPEGTVSYENWVASRVSDARAYAGFPRCEGPVRLVLEFFVQRPKSRPKKHVLPDVRPDIDNLVKAVLDGCNRAGVWRDDAQVCAIDVRKSYGEPGVKLVLEEMGVSN